MSNPSIFPPSKFCAIQYFISYITDGLKFYRSANNVILGDGNSEGLIPTKYFAKVQEHPSGIVEHLKYHCDLDTIVGKLMELT